MLRRENLFGSLSQICFRGEGGVSTQANHLIKGGIMILIILLSPIKTNLVALDKCL